MHIINISIEIFNFYIGLTLFPKVLCFVINPGVKVPVPPPNPLAGGAGGHLFLPLHKDIVYGRRRSSVQKKND